MKIIAGLFLVILSVGVFTFKTDSAIEVEPAIEEEKKITKPKKPLNREPSRISAPEIASTYSQSYVPQEEYVPSYVSDPVESYSDETVQYEPEPEMVESVYTPEENVENAEVASETIEDESV